MAQPQLAPLPAAMGLFNQFTARQTETLVLKEKVLSLSGDSFDIKLANGQPVLRVQGSVMSLSGRKSVFDMANNHLFDICKEHFHIHTTFVALDPKGVKLMEVKSSFARAFPSPPPVLNLPPFHTSLDRECIAPCISHPN